MVEHAVAVVAQRAGPGGRVLLLTLDHPPLNLLDAKTRAAMLAALERAGQSGPQADPPIEAVVLRAAGPNFSTGCTIDAPEGDALVAPRLSQLCQCLSSLPLPVVVAVQGSAVGPGAELALAADARVVAEDARFLLPEIGFGLPPCGGTTQRLPRLADTETALDMLLRARPLAAPEAVAAGLVDHLVEVPAPELSPEGTDPLTEAAITAALRLPLRLPLGGAPVALGREAARAHAQAIQAARAEYRASSLPAPARIIDCIDAAMVLPPENGIALEEVAFEDLSASPESRGLIAAGRAERAAALAPAGLALTEAAPLQRMALTGASAAQAALVWRGLGAGLEVVWADEDPARLAQGMAWLDRRVALDVEAGRLSPLQRDADRTRLTLLAAPQTLGAADLVVHARWDEAAQKIARRLSGAVHLVLGGAAGQFGLALAPQGQIAELALPQGGAPAQAARLYALLRRMGLVPVLVQGAPVIGQHLAQAGQAALARLLAMGVPHKDLRAALRDFGQAETGPGILPLPPEGASPASLAMGPEEIIRRWLAALANAGFALLRAGAVPRALDLDFVAVQGLGFPRWRGGPLHQAMERGLLVIRADLDRWAGDDPLWRPDPMIGRLLSQGRQAPVLQGL